MKGHLLLRNLSNHNCGHSFGIHGMAKHLYLQISGILVLNSPKFSFHLPQVSHRSGASGPVGLCMGVFSQGALFVDMPAGLSAPTIMLYCHKCTTVVKMGCRKKAGRWQFSIQVTISWFVFVSQIFLWETKSAPMIPTPPWLWYCYGCCFIIPSTFISIISKLGIIMEYC